MYIGTNARPVLVQKGCLSFQTEAIPIEPTDPIETQPPVKTTPKKPNRNRPSVQPHTGTTTTGTGTSGRNPPPPPAEVATPAKNDPRPDVATPGSKNPQNAGVPQSSLGVTPGRPNLQDIMTGGNVGPGVVIGTERGDIPENDIILDSWQFSHNPMMVDPDMFFRHGK